MIRRMAVVIVAVLALGALAGGGTSAVAKKKKKPKIALGAYNGLTSNGIPMNITVNPGRTSGTITYCALSSPFTITGKSFTVNYVEPISTGTIVASGFFNARQKTVSGTVAANSCDSTNQTFSLAH